MSGLDIYFREDIEGTILAGLVLMVQTARATGSNVAYLRGAMSAYQHQALAYRIPWGGLLDQARLALGVDLWSLLDTASGHILGVAHAE